MNGTDCQERRNPERSIVGCGVDELGEGAKTSAARVRTNEHFRHSHAPLLVSRRPGTMFTSVCKFHAHCTSFHDIGRMRQQRSALWCSQSLGMYEKCCCRLTIVRRTPARPGPAHSGAVLHYLKPFIAVRCPRYGWRSKNQRSVGLLAIIVKAIYLPWRSNHQYHSSRPTTASCLQCCGEYSLYIRFVVPPAQFFPIKSRISLCIVSHAPP